MLPYNKPIANFTIGNTVFSDNCKDQKTISEFIITPKKPLLSLTNGHAEMPLDIKLELFLQENDYGTHVSKEHLASIKKLMKQTKD